MHIARNTQSGNTPKLRPHTQRSDTPRTHIVPNDEGPTRVCHLAVGVFAQNPVAAPARASLPRRGRGPPSPPHARVLGCLEASDDGAVADAAHRAALVDQPSIAQVVAAAMRGNSAAHELLVERARLLCGVIVVVTPSNDQLLGRSDH